MSAVVVSRPKESQTVADFLDATATEPVALALEGEPGIGKTTLWLAAVKEAGERGFRVLSAHPAPAESVMAYLALADMLRDVDPTVWADLPDPQHFALDKALLGGGPDDRPTEQRTVAAAFLSVVHTLADEAPVLLAIDDLQWLDSPSMQVVAFVARRLPSRVRLLVAARTDSEGSDAASWLNLQGPEAIQRMRLQPMSLGGLRSVIDKRLGLSLARPALVRIHEISGGNPFYALELARAIGEPTTDDTHLPSTLAELVRTRIGSLGANVQDTLLAAACAATPTVELVAHATQSDAERVLELLEDAESKGVVGIDGNRLLFAHPLLARGVYAEATTARRRAMHRRLAEIVEDPEMQARHLALASSSADPHALQCLDKAAEIARLRGAPVAAAELLELAVGLGGDTTERKIRLAQYRFSAGDFGRAGDLLKQTIEGTAPGALRALALSLLAVLRQLDGGFSDAADLLERALHEADDNLGLRVPMLVTRSLALFNIGDRVGARRNVEDAVASAERFGQPHLLSQALGMRTMLRFIAGDGLDEPSLRRALELEDIHADTAVIFRPSTQKVLLLAWTGQLEEAHSEMLSVRRRFIERGEENELIFVAAHSMLIEIWRGDFAAARLIAEDTMERALELGGDAPLSFGLMMRAAEAAYAGRADDARRDAGVALAKSGRSYSYILAQWPIATLGFVEVSLGRYDAALTALAPLLARINAAPEGTEVFAASFVPDAVEAMVALGRFAEAEPLIGALERNGRRLDRAWMLAVGARCRAMLLAAYGDMDAALLETERAMAEHDRLPMPFERARTQLLLGQLQRRQLHKEAASSTLREALDAFEQMGTPLWAERVRAELPRVNVGPRNTAQLTPSEQRVAELAAAGMSNRDVAASLFISPKTVEANMTRIYRKLGIHTRAELGRLMSQPNR